MEKETLPTLTWRQLKEAANSIPEELLDKKVYAWNYEGEGGHDFVETMTLEEDYVFDGDEGCSPLSEIKSTYTSEEWEENKDGHHVVHPKGTVILVLNNQ